MEDTTVREQPAPPPTPPPRRLLRREEEGKLGGVCAGIADYLGLDVTVVRIAAVFLLFAGPGFPAYLVAWVIMPKAPAGTPPNPQRRGPVFGNDNGAIAGVALLLFAALIVFDGGLFDRQVLLPVLLIGAGVWLLVRDADAPGAAPPGAGPGSASGTSRGAGGDLDPSGGGAPPPVGASTWTGHATGGLGSDHVASAPPAPEASSRLAAVVLGLVALAGAAVWLLAAAGAIDPRLDQVLALALVGIGIGLVVGAWRGRARALIAPGLVLVLALTAVTAIDVPLEGGAGERRYRPATVEDVQDEYRLGAGQMRIDLRDLDLTGERLELEASVGAGQIEVLVPPDAEVLLSSRITLGQLVLPGRSDGDARDGFGIREDVVLEGTGPGGTVVLDLSVGLGQVEVNRG